MLGRLSGPQVPKTQEDWRSPSGVMPVFIDRRRGDICCRNRSFRANRRILEADMNGYLPYRETGPSARTGAVRGWQADILRGES
ncbi:hypothetical protein SAMN05216276_1015110 [Streptosporangium subroseum]|uniref:Uncharacterized protein n=1 Tax=Streptosporangium subroseum TaxID=106412 RepID=A0A239H5Q9_9ACTN|nr:hypothetical protein SAMN05216276_1015110 [Streptosporangium subroseum]